MIYKDKIASSKECYDAICGLKADEMIKVQYGTGYKGKPNYYHIKAYWSKYSKEMTYSIWTGHAGMNIDKLSKTTAYAYSYDMMSQKTTWKFKLNEMKIVSE